MRSGRERIGRSLQKPGTIFAGYSEWGQPVHEVGRDVSVLGLPADRPHAADGFRMLCRHNQWAQEFGKIRDGDEIARREKLWQELIGWIERQTGGQAAKIPAQEFRTMLARAARAIPFESSAWKKLIEPAPLHASSFRMEWHSLPPRLAVVHEQAGIGRIGITEQVESSEGEPARCGE
jgi:hypothetical protein